MAKGRHPYPVRERELEFARRRRYSLAERHANLFASVGVHPDNADVEGPTTPLGGVEVLW